MSSLTPQQSALLQGEKNGPRPSMPSTLLAYVGFELLKNLHTQHNDSLFATLSTASDKLDILVYIVDLTKEIYNVGTYHFVDFKSLAVFMVGRNK